MFNAEDPDVPAESFDTIVYGEVMNFDASTFPNTLVRITHHLEGCDSQGFEQGFGQITESGRFNFVYHNFNTPTNLSCFQGVLIRNDSVLAGPKELDLNFCTEPPLDSTRVDFRFPDDT